MAHASENRPLKKVLRHLSYSGISTAEHCLRMFHATRLSGKQARPSEKPRESGKLIHAMIEQHFKGRNPLETPVTSENAAYFDDCIRVYLQWAARFAIPQERWFAAERYDSCMVPGVPVPLVGFDDFVYEDIACGYIVLRDFKTGWSAEMLSDYLLQGDLACLRFAMRYPEHAHRLASEVEFVRSGIVSQRRLWSTDLHEQAVRRVQRAWKMLEWAYEHRNGWTVTPGSHCRFCPLVVSCGAATGAMLREDALISERDALKALEQIRLFDLAREKLITALHRYVDENGPTTTPGPYGMRARYDYGKAHPHLRDVRAAIDRIGIDAFPAGTLKIDLDLKNAKPLLEDRRLSDLISSASPTARFIVGTTNREGS